MGKMGDSDEVTDEGPVISPTRRGVRHQLFDQRWGTGEEGLLVIDQIYRDSVYKMLRLSGWKHFVANCHYLLSATKSRSTPKLLNSDAKLNVGDKEPQLLPILPNAILPLDLSRYPSYSLPLSIASAFASASYRGKTTFGS